MVKTDKALLDKLVKNLSLVAEKVETKKYKTALSSNDETITKKKQKKEDMIEEK